MPSYSETPRLPFHASMILTANCPFLTRLYPTRESERLSTPSPDSVRLSVTPVY